MGRRSDPERIFDAERAGVRARLTGTDRMQPETAERWLDAWVLEAAARDLPRDGAYWNAAYDWITAERASRRPG
jgi:aminoglycoside/choline kinase family phosphotransferase